MRPKKKNDRTRLYLFEIAGILADVSEVFEEMVHGLDMQLTKNGKKFSISSTKPTSSRKKLVSGTPKKCITWLLAEWSKKQNIGPKPAPQKKSKTGKGQKRARKEPHPFGHAA